MKVLSKITIRLTSSNTHKGGLISLPQVLLSLFYVHFTNLTIPIGILDDVNFIGNCFSLLKTRLNMLFTPTMPATGEFSKNG